MDCIVTQGVWVCSRGAMIRLVGPATRPHDTTSKGHDSVGLGAATSGACARMAWPWGESRYNGLYHGWGRPFCRNMGSDIGCDTAQQHPTTRRKGAAIRVAGFES